MVLECSVWNAGSHSFSCHGYPKSMSRAGAGATSRAARLPRLRVPQVAVDHNAALHGIELEDIQLHRLSLMERGRVMRGMMRCGAGWAGWLGWWARL